MATKRKDKLAEPRLSTFLVDLGNIKKELHLTQDHLTPFKADYNAIADLRQSIDRLAEHLTGDPEYYSAKPPRVA